MSEIRAAIIEDSPDALGTLMMKLSEVSDKIKIVGTASNEDNGYQLIRKEKPDLVFLDINLEFGGSSFNILDKLRKEDGESLEFKIIFTTGLDDSAHLLRAFRYAAIHYLPKPIKKEDLKEAISRVIDDPGNLSQEQLKILIEAVSSIDKKTGIDNLTFKVKNGDKRIISVRDIVSLKAMETMTEVQLISGEKFRAYENLGSYSNLLTDDHNFYRIHHNSTINLEYVERIVNRDRYVVMKGNQNFAASKRKWPDFVKYFEDNKKKFPNMEKKSVVLNWLYKLAGK